MDMDTRELEGRIIAMMMANRDLCLYVVKSVTEDMFFWHHIKSSFRHLKTEVLSNELSHDDEDGLGLFIEVKSLLNEKKIKKSYIADISQHVGDLYTAQEAKRLIGVLKDEYQKRMLDQMATAIKSAESVSAKREVMSEYRQVVDFSVDNNTTKSLLNVAKDVQSRLLNGEDDMQLVKFGDPKLDKYLMFIKGAVVTVAARPAVGKTSWALQKALQLVKQGYNVKMYSREMLADELFHKVVGAEFGISQYQIRDMDSHQKIAMYEDAVSQIEEHKGNLYLDDEIGSIGHLETDITIESKVKDIDVFIVDYLQLIRHDRNIQSDNSRVADISQRLKHVTLKNKTRLLLLSQLSRKIEERKVKKPVLSDLRDSGSIEQDANAVLFLERPSLYADEKGEVWVTEKEKSWVRPDLANLIIAKNRIGMTGEIEMTFIAESQTFEEV